MKGVNSVIFRALTFLAVGAMMIAFKETTTWIVVLIGILFLVPGIVSMASFFRSYSKKDSTHILLPIVGGASIILGATILIMPQQFLQPLQYLLAVALLIAGAYSLVNLIHFKKFTSVHWGFFIIPLILCGAAIFIIFNPIIIGDEQIQSTLPFTIFSIGSVVYSFYELFNAIRFRKVLQQIWHDKHDVKPIAEESAPVTEPQLPELETIAEPKEIEDVAVVDAVETEPVESKESAVVFDAIDSEIEKD